MLYPAVSSSFQCTRSLDGKTCSPSAFKKIKPRFLTSRGCHFKFIFGPGSLSLTQRVSGEMKALVLPLHAASNIRLPVSLLAVFWVANMTAVFPPRSYSSICNTRKSGQKLCIRHIELSIQFLRDEISFEFDTGLLPYMPLQLRPVSREIANTFKPRRVELWERQQPCAPLRFNRKNSPIPPHTIVPHVRCAPKRHPCTIEILSFCACFPELTCWPDSMAEINQSLTSDRTNGDLYLRPLRAGLRNNLLRDVQLTHRPAIHNGILSSLPAHHKPGKC